MTYVYAVYVGLSCLEKISQSPQALSLTKADHFKVDKQLGTDKEYLLYGQLTALPSGSSVCLAPMKPVGSIDILTKLDERAHFLTNIHDSNLHCTLAKFVTFCPKKRIPFFFIYRKFASSKPVFYLIFEHFWGATN